MRRGRVLGTACGVTAGVLALMAAPAAGQELLVNGGAEDGNLGGWVLDGSEFPAGDAVFAAASIPPSMDFTPYDGELMFIFSAVSTGAPINSMVVARMSQQVSAPAAGALLRFRAALASGVAPSCDPGRAILRALDEHGEEIGPGADTGWVLSQTNWQVFEFELSVPEGAAAVEVVLEGRLDCGVFIDAFFDAVSLTMVGCGPADLAPPFGVLDFFDVQRFLNDFSAMDDAADFNDDGLFDFFDVQEFLQQFSAGCG